LALPTSPPSKPLMTINPVHLSAALKAEKRHGRTTETDPSVPREEYVCFQGPFILVTDKAQVHKPILVKEYPAGSDREHARWPMFWATKEGSCPFIKPSHPVKPVIIKPPVLGESKVVNRRMTEQPASGIVNSSNAFSAIRSTTTCGSNLTSTTVAGISTGLGVSRQVRGLETKLTPAVASVMPPPKKRRLEPLREQAAKKKKEKKEGYCENCKDRYDDYDEVFYSWNKLTKHCQSRKHRKYARNNKNFVELDLLLKLLERPLLKEEEPYATNCYS
jgi:regulatory subunit for Cdc7p protein kinase